MQITLNGKSTEIEGESLTISEFLSMLETGKQPVLVELNGEAVLVKEFDHYRLNEGDTVEVIRMVAGG